MSGRRHRCTFALCTRDISGFQMSCKVPRRRAKECGHAMEKALYWPSHELSGPWEPLENESEYGVRKIYWTPRPRRQCRENSQVRAVLRGSLSGYALEGNFNTPYGSYGTVRGPYYTYNA